MAGYVARYDGTMVRVGDRFVTLAKGAAVPDGADAGHVRVLLDRGIVAEGDPVAGFTTVGGVDPASLAPARPAPVVEQPAKSANRADWDAYAKSQGLTDEEVAAFSSKEDLQKHFGVE